MVDRADTQRVEGTYQVEGTNLILESRTVPVVRDTMGFSVRADTLCLFTNPGEEASLVTRLVPGAGPPIPILKFIRVGMPDTGTPGVVLTADFDGSGQVDFSDFLLFAGGYGILGSDLWFDPRFDLDGNHQVGFSDFLIFAGIFGRALNTTP